MAFQIVLGAEQPLAARLALAARDRAQRVEAAGDGREEALLRLHIGRDRPKQRRLLLVGAVRAAEALNGGVRLPACLEQVVDAQPGVLRRLLRMVATAGAAGVAEHQHALLVIHERLRLGEIGGSCARLDDKPVDGDAAAGLAHDTPRPARHLGDHVRAEVLDELVERAGNRRQAGELGDQRVAAGDSLPAFDRLAVAIDWAR